MDKLLGSRDLFIKYQSKDTLTLVIGTAGVGKTTLVHACLGNTSAHMSHLYLREEGGSSNSENYVPFTNATVLTKICGETQSCLSFIDMPGFSDEDTTEIRAILCKILNGDFKVSKDILTRTAADCKIDKIIFVAACGEDIPCRLMGAVEDVACKSGVPVFGVLTNTDSAAESELNVKKKIMADILICEELDISRCSLNDNDISSINGTACVQITDNSTLQLIKRMREPSWKSTSCIKHTVNTSTVIRWILVHILNLIVFCDLCVMIVVDFDLQTFTLILIIFILALIASYCISRRVWYEVSNFTKILVTYLSCLSLIYNIDFFVNGVSPVDNMTAHITVGTVCTFNIVTLYCLAPWCFQQRERLKKDVLKILIIFIVVTYLYVGNDAN